jgi:peptidoglycan hydrolase-like protein with peptidoglycan-binding domain
LKKGSGGAKVEALQRFLNQSSGYNLVVDGKYGQNTEGAVYSEQSPFDVFKGMYPDAVKGQVTEGYYNAFIKGKF